jgi:diadenylate cyclase
VGTTDILRQLFSRLTAYPVWEIALELAIIWLLAWMIWRFVEGTRAAGALKGILLILLGFLLLRLLVPTGSFERLSFLGDRFLGFVALALVIVFQPEIRRAMIRIGEAPIFSQTSADVEPVIASVVKACEFLSKNRFGALIAIEGRVGLRELIERATPINADVSAELLQAIFWPNSPLHDMGVVVRGSYILAAGVQFPLAEPADMPDKRLGTRHRAALGLARVTDTIVIVVSEETGAISMAHHGRLQRWLTIEGLQSELHRRLSRIGQAVLIDEELPEDAEQEASA